MGQYREYKKNIVDVASSNFIDIDTLVSVYTETQKMLGVPPIFKEGTKQMAEENKEEDKTCNHECTTCKKSKKTKPEGFDFKMQGISVDDEYDSDEDDFFVCDICTALGYRRQYKPDICDSCKRCESCRMYLDDDCSGCSYSTYRDGEFYRNKLSDSELFSEYDLEVFESMKLDEKGGTRYEMTRFSIDEI